MMKRREWLNVLLCVSCFSSTNAEIRITEVMTNNVSTIISDKYDYDGFVEFYNDGGNVDLREWTVTNLKGEKTNWSLKLDSTHVLPYGYSLLFFGKSETSSISASKVQYNYVGRVGGKLSTDAGSIFFEKDGKKITYTYPKQYPHISYCENGFMEPTPGKENNHLVTSISNRVATPFFKSGEPGFHENKLNVEFGCETEGAKIYYTTNGDVPTPDKGKVYNGAIGIDTTIVLRARAYKDGMLFSEILTGSYIFSDSFYDECNGVGERLPIVSITANDEDIYGDMRGIYVEGKNGIANSCTPASNYNQDWMRSANFEYILDGKVVDNQEVEIGVYGGCTRIYKIKSLKIKANKRSGKNKFNYDSFFTNSSYKKYKSLALRNGGNGYYYIPPRWRDMFIQSLADGMNVDKQEAQPVAYYLNGKFCGMMILTERTDEDYVYHNYGLDEDEIDLLNGSGRFQLESGTMDAYNNMMDYATKNYTNPDFYDILNTHMDVDEYIDYHIIEQYVGNTDWVANNIKIWRKHDGGRFRWILFDTDFGLSKATKLDTNMLDFASKLVIGSHVKPMVDLLGSCMKNEDFRWKFLDQYIDRLENTFTDERIDTKIDSIMRLTELDMCATMKKSGPLSCPSDKNYRQDIEYMRSFAKQRKSYVIDQLKKEFGLGDRKINIKVRTVFPNDETPEFSFLLNKREYKVSRLDSRAFINERVKVEPVIPRGYKIQRWLVNNEVYRTPNGSKYMENYLTAIADTGDLKISIIFDHDEDYALPTDIYLNEICAQNETTLDENGEASDWIELYNGSDKDIDIAGMTIVNVTKSVRCTIPSGNESTIVPAQGYKLLWADKNTDLGPLHLNFKLGVSVPEKISLRSNMYDKEVELSNISYNPHKSDESYGRQTDGASAVKLFAKCIDEEGNETITSSPMSANGNVVCKDFDSVKQQTSVKNGRRVYAQGKKIFVHNAKGSDVRVYSLLGNVIVNAKSDSDIFNVIIPNPGVYLVKVDSQCWKIVVE